MSPEREAELASRHSTYIAAQLRDGESACGDGWFNVIDRLLTAIEARNPKRFKLTQVKQKIGRLRVYAKGATLDGEALIDAAEAESATVCEVCGEAGVLRWEDGRAATRCESHRYPIVEEKQ